jgi:hypothetical protein
MDIKRLAARTTLVATAGLLAATTAVPARDLRSPDARAAGKTCVHDVMPWQDLRTPDAQDAAFDVEHGRTPSR